MSHVMPWSLPLLSNLHKDFEMYYQNNSQIGDKNTDKIIHTMFEGNVQYHFHAHYIKYPL